MYKIAIERNVVKFLEKHRGEKLIKLFKEKLIVLSKNPYKNNLDIKALNWNEDKYRLRIWKYRFIYEVQDDIITISILSADSRGGMYK